MDTGLAMTPLLSLYLSLERLMFVAEGVDERTADVIRDAMDPIWYVLTDEDRETLNHRVVGFIRSLEGLRVPADLPGAPNPELLQHVTTDRSDAIFSPGDYAVAIATLLDPATEAAHLRLDLRPLGIDTFDDPGGLHVGNNVFVGNVIEGAAVAINLA